jgi:hypothetical protein
VKDADKFNGGDRQRGATPCHNKPDNALLPQAYYDELFKRRVDSRSSGRSKRPSQTKLNLSTLQYHRQTIAWP